MDNFVARLDWVLADRPKHPWGKQLGIGQGPINTMFKGSIPSHEFLSAICRYENISLNWLLEGKGAPCLVHRFDSDEATAEYLATLLEDEPWDIHVVGDHRQYAVVLTQPGAYECKKEFVEYTLVEILTGACAGLTGRVARRAAATVYNAYIVEATPDEMQALQEGKLTNYRLVYGKDAILGRKLPLEDNDLFWATLPTQSGSEQEAEILERFRDLSRSNQQALIEFLKKWK